MFYGAPEIGLVDDQTNLKQLKGTNKKGRKESLKRHIRNKHFD